MLPSSSRRALFALLVLAVGAGCQVLSGVSGLTVDSESGGENEGGGFIDPGDGGDPGDGAGGEGGDADLDGGETVLVRVEIRKFGGGNVATVKVNGIQACAGTACTGTVLATVPKSTDGGATTATIVVDPVIGSDAHFLDPTACRTTPAGCQLALTTGFVRVTVQAVAANYVFATNAKYNGSLGGLAGGDMKCKEAATAAGLPGTYAAWLSDATTNASARLGTARGFIRVDGQPFSDSLQATAGQDLVEGRVFFPVGLDPFGVALPKADFAWTGTAPDGVLGAGTACANWTSGLAAESAITGAPLAGSVAWTSRAPAPDTCEKPGHLICFRKDKNATVTPVARPVPSRVAFVTDAPFTMTAGGIAVADALCTAEAAAAAPPLAGTFKAYLATSTAAAQTRFSLLAAKGAWYRVDGTPVFADPAVLQNLTGRPITGVTQHADGTYATDDPVAHVDVWTGMNAAPNAASTSVASSCNDWTDGTIAATGRFGQSPFVDERFTSAGTSDCSVPRPVYCLQE